MTQNSTLCSQCGVDGYIALEVFRGVRLCKRCKSKIQYPRWPRGKHNGQRIIGFSVKLQVTTQWWGLKPLWPKYAGLSWLWFLLWIEPVYE